MEVPTQSTYPKDPLKNYTNAPLGLTSYPHMLHHHPHDGVPRAHVAAKFSLSRFTGGTWATRYIESGKGGLPPHLAHPDPRQQLRALLHMRSNSGLEFAAAPYPPCMTPVSVSTASRPRALEASRLSPVSRPRSRCTCLVMSSLTMVRPTRVSSSATSHVMGPGR